MSVLFVCVRCIPVPTIMTRTVSCSHVPAYMLHTQRASRSGYLLKGLALYVTRQPPLGTGAVLWRSCKDQSLFLMMMNL